jgi:hypothetical protein
MIGKIIFQLVGRGLVDMSWIIFWTNGSHLQLKIFPDHLYPWKVWNNNNPISRIIPLEQASFNKRRVWLACLKSWFERTISMIMQWWISCCAYCAPHFFVPSENLKQQQTTIDQDQHHWKVHSFYTSVLVDWQIFIFEHVVTVAAVNHWQIGHWDNLLQGLQYYHTIKTWEIL